MASGPCFAILINQLSSHIENIWFTVFQLSRVPQTFGRQYHFTQHRNDYFLHTCTTFTLPSMHTAHTYIVGRGRAAGPSRVCFMGRALPKKSAPTEVARLLSCGGVESVRGELGAGPGHVPSRSQARGASLFMRDLSNRFNLTNGLHSENGT